MTEPLRNAPANQQWGGRFAAGPAAVMQEINASIGFDKRLWRQDIQGSLAHAAMLASAGIIAATDERDIRRGLEAIAAEIESGAFPFTEALEDIHMNIEARLTERIGEAGKRLHTARSRNDQVATDFRLWVRDAIDGLDTQVKDVMQRARRPRRRPRGRPDARLHSPADRPAGHARPPSSRLCRDVVARIAAGSRTVAGA